MSEVQEQNFYIVGWVSDAHGIRGESYIRFYTNNPEWLSEVNELSLVQITGAGKERLKKKRKAEHLLDNEVIEKRVLKFSKSKPHKQGYIFKFEDIKDRNQAEDLKGYIVQIPKILLDSFGNEDEFYYHKIMGFTLFDQNNKNCGIVSSHYNNSAHDILVLENDYPSKEVPFINDWIKNIDFEKKEIRMELPEGLFDLKA